MKERFPDSGIWCRMYELLKLVADRQKKKIERKKERNKKLNIFPLWGKSSLGSPQHECLHPNPMLNQWSLAQTMAPSWTQLFANHANQKARGSSLTFPSPSPIISIYYQGLLALFFQRILNLTTCPHLHFTYLSYHYFFPIRQIASFLVLLIVGSYSQPLTISSLRGSEWSC